MTEQTMKNAEKLHGALLVAADATGAYVQMLEIQAHSERYTEEVNTAMLTLTALIAKVSADNQAEADRVSVADAEAQEVLDELEDEALDVVAEMEHDAAEVKRLAEVMDRIEEENAAAIEAIEVQNVANGLSVDDDRFMDGINRAENYLPPLSALPETEKLEVERVLNDATPFPGCDTSGEVEETSGASEYVQVEPTAETAEAIAPADDDSVRSDNPYSGVDFGNLRSGYVPSFLGEGIFSLPPETD